MAEVCFAAQWAMVAASPRHDDGVDAATVAWTIVPLILIAECFSWYAVLTTDYLGNAIENSIWALAFFIIAATLCRLLPDFDGACA